MSIYHLPGMCNTLYVKPHLNSLGVKLQTTKPNLNPVCLTAGLTFLTSG